MNLRIVAYWTTTVAIAFGTVASALLDLQHGRTDVFIGSRVDAVLLTLGYPVYVVALIRILKTAWKIGCAVILVMPGLLRSKEWAYAGIVFDLLGTAESYELTGKRLGFITPLTLIAIALASWSLRPAHRVLGPRLQ